VGVEMKKIIIFIIISIVAIAIAIGYTFNQQEKSLAAITFESIDLSRSTDGIYTGSYDTNLIKVTVEVTIENQRILEITILKHENGLGDEAKNIVTDIILEQDHQVDVISGATGSSNVIKKAVEVAIKKSIK